MALTRLFVHDTFYDATDNFTYTPGMRLTLDNTTQSARITRLQNSGVVSTDETIDPAGVAITGGNIDGTVIGATTAAAGTFTTITVDTTTLVTDAANNRVGVGTATPAVALDVVGQHQVTHTGQQVLRVRRDTSATYTVADVTSYTKNAASGYVASGAHGFGLADTTASTEDGYYRLAIMEAGSSNTVYSIVGAGNHAWAISNSELMRLNSTGLGLGTTSPAVQLHVTDAARIGGVAADSSGVGLVSTGSASFAAGVQVRNFDAAGWARLDLYHQSASAAALLYQKSTGTLTFRNDSTATTAFDWQVAGTSHMVMDSSGNIGIGTTSPTSPLHVSGTGSLPILVETTANNGRIEVKAPITPAVRLTATGGADYTVELSASYSDESMILKGGSGYKVLTATGFSTPEITNLYSNNTLAVTIDGSQNVGIGTTSPSYALHIGDGTTATVQLALQSTDAGATIINMGDASNAAAGKITYSNSTNTFTFVRAGSVDMTLDTNGLGIGTTSPDWDLDVNGTCFAFNYRGRDTGFTVGGDADLLGAALQFYPTSGQIRGYINGSQVLTQTSTGLGLNETAPDYALDVNGTFGFTPGTSVTPVDNGDVVFEATNNTTFTVKLKGTDGTVRSGTVTLA